MDIVFDIVFGVLLGLVKLIAPRYDLKKRQETLLIILGGLLFVASWGCFVGGVYVLAGLGSHKTLGIVLTSVGAALILMQSLVFFVSAGLRLKKDAHAKKDDTTDDRY